MGFRAFAVWLPALAMAFTFSPAKADTNIEAVPTGWRLQNYTGSNVTAYHTGSSCASGALLFSSSASVDPKNRFWSMVMTAKATGHAVEIFYDSNCNIISFYEP